MGEMGNDEHVDGKQDMAKGRTVFAAGGGDGVHAVELVRNAAGAG